MKNLLSVAFISSVLLTACSKKNPVNMETEQDIKVHYDTTAIDSFSTGAISVDIARQIRMSSRQYQDSLKEALRLQKEEKRIKEEVEKENKKKLEEEKKKADDEKKHKAAESSTVNETKSQ